ncbi:MAG: hypothetical protein EPO51_04330 [Phenylobacterium sp.]|uniref:hypothetical protein n=1 Tax=Phenylobacterium sp. TaxID=1871053 RepID=UPI0012227342|nr:hypothetical protein [Phenylobacterium sp.]TAJ73711.1 MAG: hypothetical protein EPO51_04330 [Phenylobacterium sp.]
MSVAALDDRLAPLQTLCRGEPSVRTESGVTYVVLPGLRFTSAGAEQEINGVLVPQQVPELGGYTTRLLLESKPPKPELNWTMVSVLGRQWNTWSWNNIPGSWPWVEILAAHLKALA